MLRNSKKLALGAAAALIGSTAISGAAFVNTADARPITRTIKLVAHSDRTHGLGPRTFAGTEIDRNHGKLVGYDLISGIFNPHTRTVKIYVAVTRRGGLLFGRVHDTSETTYVGRVTGGSGRFAGAHGTVTARNAPHDDSKTFITIHYTIR